MGGVSGNGGAKRRRLPNRRPCVTETIYVGEEGTDGTRFHVTFGFFDDGRVGEIFLNARKADSEQDRWASDAGVLVSILLQAGFRPRELAAGMGRLSGGVPATAAGAALDLAARLSEEN